MSTYFCSVVIIGLSVGLLLSALSPLWSKYFGNVGIIEYAFFLLLFPLTKTLTTGADNLLINFGRTKTLIVYRIIHSITQLIIIVFIEIIGGTFKAYMILFVLCEILFSLIVLFIAAKNVGNLKFRIDISILKLILNFSVPLGLASAVGIINVEMDKLVIGHFLSTEQMAIYSNAARELPVAILATSFTAVLMPKISKMIKDKKEIEACALWSKVAVFSYYVLVFFIFFFCSFSKEIMTILYSEKYVSGYTIFIIYSLTLIFQVTHFGMYLNVSGHTKLILLGSILSMFSNLILNVGLFFTLGINGPAIATWISTGILAVFQIVMTVKIINKPFKLLFNLSGCIIPTVTCLIMGIFVYLIRGILHVEEFNYIQVVIAGIVTVGLYIAITGKRILSLAKELSLEK